MATLEIKSLYSIHEGMLEGHVPRCVDKSEEDDKYRSYPSGKTARF